MQTTGGKPIIFCLDNEQINRIRSYLERLAKIDAANRHVRVALPGAHYRLERFYLRIWASLVAVEPHARAAVALVLHLASVRALAPATSVLRRQSQAHAAVVRHVAATVYHKVYIVWIIQGFGTAPDYCERYRDVRRARGIREFRLLAVDRVGQQTRVYARHATLDVELAHEPRLYDELLKIAQNASLHIASQRNPKIQRYMKWL